MLYTRERLNAMGEPAQDLIEAMKRRPPPDNTGGDPNASMQTVRKLRADNLTKIRHLYPIASIPDNVKQFDATVKARDGYDIPVKITVPRAKTSSKSSPLIVLFHEGGWCFGDPTDEYHDAWLFTRDLEAVCINVDYRLAPEHRYPTGLHDCHDVTKWAATTASPSSDILPADPSVGFVVGGSSAGGNLSAVMAQLTRDEGMQPPLTGQYLSVPAMVDDFGVPEKWKADYCSRRTKKDPILDLSEAPHPIVAALGAGCDDIRWNPLLHPDLKGLAPAYFQICGVDPLRDEDLIYVDELQKNGVKVKYNLYEGYGHMFWMNWPELERAKDFFSDTLKGVKWLLEQSS